MLYHRQSFHLQNNYLISWNEIHWSFSYVFGTQKLLFILSQLSTWKSLRSFIALAPQHIWLTFISENRTVLEKRHHVFNIGSTETVKCSKVETKLNQNISWHNGSTGVKIKSGGKIELNGLSFKIKNFQLDDAGTYECRGESSTRLYTIYAYGKLSFCSFCSSPQHYFHHHSNAMFFFHI